MYEFGMPDLGRADSNCQAWPPLRLGRQCRRGGIRSAGSTRRARASFSTVSRVAERSARSMNEIAVRCKPDRRASSSWERSRSVRTARTRSPKSCTKVRRLTGLSVESCGQ